MEENGKNRRIHLVEIREPKHRRFVPYIALAVSIVTAGILIWQGFETRDHYRRVVSPQVLAYTTNAVQNDPWGIFLQNEGAGPAFVKLHRMTIDGVEKDPVDILNQIIAEKIIKDTNSPIRRLMGENLVLKEGAITPIIAFVPAEVNPDKITDFQELINHRIDLKYRWCSVYNDCTEACTAHMCKK